MGAGLCRGLFDRTEVLHGLPEYRLAVNSLGYFVN